MTKKLYSFNDHPEHKARLAEWRDKWIANAMSTSAMTETDRDICRKAVIGLYEAAGLPAPKHIVFVPSPFVLRFAGGFAAARWYLHHQNKALTEVGATDQATAQATRQATDQATYQATAQATYQATAQATYQATDQATDQATAQATYQATAQATDQATRQATAQATYQATAQATYQATDQATDQATAQATYQATAQATDQATRQATAQATRQATYQATYQATDQATDQATYQATDQATRQATDQATAQATDQATRQATYQATRQATDQATYQATDQATYQATYQATRQATDQATYQATAQATAQATYQATDRADLSKFWVFREDARAVSEDVGVGAFGIMCAQRSWGMWQGGNQWSGWDSFLSFFREIAKLPLDYSKYEHWQTLSEHSGPRIVHPDFCMISDRPEVLLVDDQDRPHCETGPFCRWRDGSAIYAWHGTFVPARWIEERDTLDPNEVIRAENVEQRAAGAAIVGWPKMLSVLGCKVVDDSGSPDIGQLIELTLPGLDQPGRFLKAECPRNGIIVEGVPYVSDIDGLPISTALHAQAWRIGDPLSDYQHPPART